MGAKGLTTVIYWWLVLLVEEHRT